MVCCFHSIIVPFYFCTLYFLDWNIEKDRDYICLTRKRWRNRCWTPSHLMFALHPADPDVILVGLPCSFLHISKKHTDTHQFSYICISLQPKNYILWTNDPRYSYLEEVNAVCVWSRRCLPYCRTSHLLRRCPTPHGKGHPWKERDRESGSQWGKATPPHNRL